jgi:hypothetical protein
MPFLVLVLCYTFIFIKLLFREHDQRDWFINRSTLTKIIHFKTERKSLSNHSLFSDYDVRQKRASTYAKARSKTFRMVSLEKGIS